MTIDAGGTLRIGGDIVVHRMGYGAMRLCGPFAAGPCADPEAPRRVLRRAIALGVDFIDTADSYGPWINEEQIAAALHPYPAGLIVATKGGTIRTPGDPRRRDYDNSPAYLRAAVEGSLRRLKLERIPLYQIHRLDGRTPIEDSLGALDRLRLEGKIGHIGLSEVDVPTLEAAQAITRIATVQNLYNLAERRHQPVLDWCEREGAAFIPWFPLGGGTGSDAEGVATDIAARLGVSAKQVALAWLLGKSPAMLLIPGTASVDHLEENVAACDITLSADDRARLDGASG
jgi:aryl-alcohol dehydrogenase-like predicted oxidoreductase